MFSRLLSLAALDVLSTWLLKLVYCQLVADIGYWIYTGRHGTRFIAKMKSNVDAEIV
jgi:hypothetical protein